jgi:hypothetical protein
MQFKSQLRAGVKSSCKNMEAHTTSLRLQHLQQMNRNSGGE